MPDAKYAETRRMAEFALRESAGVDLVADWQAAALSVCRTVLDAPQHEAGEVSLGVTGAPQPAREPLTDKQLVACIEAAGFTTWDSRMWELKRQVEAAHGITQKDAG